MVWMFSGCLGVGVQLGRVIMETAPLQSIDEIAQKLVSIFLSSESKVPLLVAMHGLSIIA